MGEALTIRELYEGNIKRIIKERIEKYGYSKCVYPQKNISEMTLEELQEYVELFCALKYDTYGLPDPDCEWMCSTRDSLNAEFDKRMGPEFIAVYNYFDKENNTEKWNGDERYKLFLKYSQPYTETSVFLGAYQIIKFWKEKNNIDMSCIPEFLSLTRIPYWKLKKDPIENQEAFLDILKSVVSGKIGVKDE